ncbi:MAG: energy transducer TonB [Acidobacteriota bacterium]|nr:MAG: energy transducer TonB [Acidobacteriota bacterium]
MRSLEAALDLDELAEPNRASARRFATTIAISLLVHALLLLGASAWTGSPAPLADETELLVPLEFEPLPEPAPPPAPPPQTDPLPSETEQRPEEPAADESLLGFDSSGEGDRRADRPVGPEAEIHAPPAPGGGPGQPDETRSVEAIEQPPAAPVPERRDPSSGERAAELPPEPLTEPAEAQPAPGSEAEESPFDESAPAPGEPQEATPPPPSRVEPEPIRPAKPERPEGPGSSLDFDVEIHGGLFPPEIDFESGDYDWSDYAIKLYFAVYRAWLRELDARVRRFERDQKLGSLPRLEGEVIIRFVLRRDGSAVDLEVLEPSVLSSLDDASAAALRRAVIPPLPRDFPRDQERITFRFLIGFDNALQLERRLELLRWRGEF